MKQGDSNKYQDAILKNGSDTSINMEIKCWIKGQHCIKWQVI